MIVENPSLFLMPNVFVVSPDLPAGSQHFGTYDIADWDKPDPPVQVQTKNEPYYSPNWLCTCGHENLLHNSYGCNSSNGCPCKSFHPVVGRGFEGKDRPSHVAPPTDDGLLHGEGYKPPIEFPIGTKVRVIGHANLTGEVIGMSNYHNPNIWDYAIRLDHMADVPEPMPYEARASQLELLSPEFEPQAKEIPLHPGVTVSTSKMSAAAALMLFGKAMEVSSEKTPGQIAYEAFTEKKGYDSDWNHCCPDSRECWEAAAKAVQVASQEFLSDTYGELSAASPLTFDTYADLAHRTEAMPDNEMVLRLCRVIDQMMDMFTEITRLADQFDMLKKYVFYNKMPVGEHFRKNFPPIDFTGKANLNVLTRTLEPHGGFAPDDLYIITRLVHGVVGTITEAGELGDGLHKLLTRFGNADVKASDESYRIARNLLEESGDGLWYQPIICSAITDFLNHPLFGSNQNVMFTFGSVADGNIAKLKRRYPVKFAEQEAVNRDTDAEMVALEQTANVLGANQGCSEYQCQNSSCRKAFLITNEHLNTSQNVDTSCPYCKHQALRIIPAS